MMFNCYSIKSVRFVPNTLSVDLDLSVCSALNKDSVISALRACKQLDTAGSAVLAFNTAVYSADLMPEIEAAVAKGFKVNGIHCGIRKNKSKKDLALIYSENKASAAAVYTTNLV